MGHATLASTVQVGVILFDFAPDFDLAGLTVRWQTVAVAATIIIVLGLAAMLSRLVRRDDPEPSHALPGVSAGDALRSSGEGQ